MPPPDPSIGILLVDDQRRNLVALESALGGLNGNLVRAFSGPEALECVLAQDFAVILLDVAMPTMDGFETARLIRSRDRSQSTPIIFLTAYDRGGERIQEGYRLGAIDYIYKPFDREILRSKVSFFVELFRKSIALEQVTADLKLREQQFAALNADLEDRVFNRTAALETANRELAAEADERAPHTSGSARFGTNSQRRGRDGSAARIGARSGVIGPGRKLHGPSARPGACGPHRVGGDRHGVRDPIDARRRRRRWPGAPGGGSCRPGCARRIGARVGRRAFAG